MGVCASSQQIVYCSQRCGRPATAGGMCASCYNQQKQLMVQPPMMSSPPPYSSVQVQQQPVAVGAPVQSPIQVGCPSCQQQMRLPYYAPQAQCPRCRTVFAVPQTATSGGQQTIIIERQQPQYVNGGYGGGSGMALAEGFVGGLILGELLEGGFGGGGGFW